MYRTFFFSLLTSFFFITQCWSAPARFSAPRALRIVDAGGRVLDGNLTDPAWTPSGEALYFTRSWGGTSNVWKASQVPGDTSRFAAWRAAPVTRFEAPLYATCAQPLPDNASFICVTNAVSAPGAPQVAQLAKVSPNGSFQALTTGPYRSEQAVVSPDGSMVAFTSNRSGFESVYLLTIPASTSVPESPRRMVLRARNPSWGPDGMLLFENLRPLSTGLYKAVRPGDPASPPSLLAGVGGPASYSIANGSLALAGMGASGPSQLYVLSPDGSGLRVLGGTVGADRPAYRPDGGAIVYQAPLAEVARAPLGLWLVQLLREPPVARLAEIRPTSERAYAIVGTVSGEGATARLEVGQSDTPRRWETLPVVSPPVVDSTISIWKPPSEVGTWTIRLSVSSPEGSSAQALMLVTLPLDISSGPVLPIQPVSVPPVLPMPTPMVPTGPAPAATPSSQNPPLVIIPAPIVSGSNPGLVVGTLLPSLPMPALPGAPGSRPPASGVGPRSGNRAPLRGPLGAPEGPRPTAKPAPRPAASPQLPPSTAPSSTAPRSAAPRSGLAGDAGTFNVAGTLASMSPGQVINVRAWVKNSGRTSWPVRANGQGAVRIVARWLDFQGGQRRKWAMEWLPTAITPGNSHLWNFELKAPTKPGRYRLVYGLLRMRGANTEIPPTSVPQEKWPGEFAAIAFAVDVK